jgi:GAF domain-containing protein
VIVEEGGFLLSWVGRLEPETNAVVLVATRGVASDYARNLTVYADERPEGRGPTGSCIREGRPFVFNDFLHDELSGPWRERAAAFGIGAAAAFPIVSKGLAWGALTVYADKPGSFGDKDVVLFGKVTENIGFALDNLERRRQRKAAEEERETIIAFLSLVNRSRSKEEMVREALTFVHQRSGFEAVGIRLKEGENYPYYMTQGVSDKFVQVEDRLSGRHQKGEPIRESAGNPVLECLCDNVIHGRFDPAKPFFTGAGELLD